MGKWKCKKCGGEMVRPITKKTERWIEKKINKDFSEGPILKNDGMETDDYHSVKCSQCGTTVNIDYCDEFENNEERMKKVAEWEDD